MANVSQYLSKSAPVKFSTGQSQYRSMSAQVKVSIDQSQHRSVSNGQNRLRSKSAPVKVSSVKVITLNQSAYLAYTIPWMHPQDAPARIVTYNVHTLG